MVKRFREGLMTKLWKYIQSKSTEPPVWNDLFWYSRCSGNAWTQCLTEEKVPYITAFVKEVLRFFSVIPICLPRVSIQDIVYNNAVIPAGSTFFMNAWAANYDSSHFKDANSFSVERYLDVPERAGTLHYAFGAGSRMCSGHQLASRELYTAFVRLISAFTIEPPKNAGDAPILDALECNQIPTVGLQKQSHLH